MVQDFAKSYGSGTTNATLRGWLPQWTNPFPTPTAGFLVQVGLEEHFGLGQRYEAAYNELLGSGGYNPLNTSFQNTQVERTAVSGQSFAAGLYYGRGTLPNHISPIYSYNLPKRADPILRPFDMCPLFQEAEKKAESSSPSQAWLDQYMPSMIQRFSSLFNTPVDAPLVQDMYEACAYEFAVLNISDHFCSIFEEQDFLVFEYATDLQEYYSRSYGLPIAWKIGAPLLHNLVETMQQKFSALTTAPNTAFKTTFFRFAHAETMEPLLSILGLYNDTEPLQATWNWTQIKARQFKTSKLFPFASNLAMFGYDCRQARGLSEQFYVKFQHNEQDVVIPRCRSSSTTSPFCGFEEFKREFHDRININFGQLCMPPTPQTPEPVANAPLPKFQPIYVWGPAVLMATLFVSFIAGFCVGTRRPMFKRKEPLLAEYQ